jgi:hypothetical protein
MAEYELPSEWEITLDEENEKQAIIPHPEENDPKAIVAFDEFEGEYYVDLYHCSIKPAMDELIGSVEKKTFDSRDEALDCYERFARNYRELVSATEKD